MNVLRVQPDSLGIERVLLCKVDHGVRLINSLEGKCLDQLLACQLLAVVFWRPSEQTQEIDERLRQKAGIAIRSDAHHRPVPALGQLGAIRRHKQRKVSELRWLNAGGLKNQNVFKG